MRRQLVLMATTVVLATGAAACSATGSGEGPTPTSAGSATTTSAADGGGATTTEPDGPVERTAEPDAIVASLAPTEDDLEAGEQLTLRERGDEVDDQVTLDYCGLDYASESSRLARRQLSIISDEEVAASVEVVLYEGGADVALDELRDAIDQCPEDEFVNPVIEGQAPLIWDDEPLPDDDLGDLAEDRVAVTLTVTPEEGDPQVMTAIWQVRGDAMIGTYAADPDRALALAAAGNERLEAATPADLGL